MLDSLPSLFSLPFVLLLTSLRLVSRMFLFWTLTLWEAVNSSSIFPVTHSVRKDNEIESCKRSLKLQQEVVSPDP